VPLVVYRVFMGSYTVTRFRLVCMISLRHFNRCEIKIVSYEVCFTKECIQMNGTTGELRGVFRPIEFAINL
jgi:hypothetical protein